LKNWRADGIIARRRPCDNGRAGSVEKSPNATSIGNGDGARAKSSRLFAALGRTRLARRVPIHGRLDRSLGCPLGYPLVFELGLMLDNVEQHRQGLTHDSAVGFDAVHRCTGYAPHPPDWGTNVIRVHRYVDARRVPNGFAGF
jgi:hypothetical protein